MMKVTALIPDHLIDEVKRLTGGANITESLIIALNDYASRQRTMKVIQKVKKQPLSFRSGFSANGVRNLTRDT